MWLWFSQWKSWTNCYIRSIPAFIKKSDWSKWNKSYPVSKNCDLTHRGSRKTKSLKIFVLSLLGGENIQTYTNGNAFVCRWPVTAIECYSQTCLKMLEIFIQLREEKREEQDGNHSWNFTCPSLFSFLNTSLCSIPLPCEV